MRSRALLVLAISIHACVNGGETSSDDNQVDAAGSAGASAGGSAGSAGGSGGVSSPDASGDGGCVPPKYEEFHALGCGPNTPAPACGYANGGTCGVEFCSCRGITISSCEGWALEPFAHGGPCQSDAGTDVSDSADASDGDGCVWLYDLPGCGSNAPLPVCTDAKDDACTLPFCGCDGVTFMGGCGKSSVPFAAYGPCQGDGG
jgi:hypothetical protein